MPDTNTEKQQQSTPVVVDNRSMPPGVMKKTIQSWVLIGLIVLMMLVMWLTGGGKATGKPPQNPPAEATKPADTTSADEFARHLEQIQRQQLQAAPAATGTPISSASPATASMAGDYTTQPGAVSQTAPAPDPVTEDLKKRNYTSLYSSSVALSYRQPENRPQEAAQSQPLTPEQLAAISGLPLVPAASGSAPGLDNIPTTTPGAPSQAQPRPTPRPVPANPNSATGKEYTIFEGTLLETVLVNRLDGDFSGPVLAMLTSDVYSHDRQRLLIPAGSKLIGESKQVDSFGQRRLAVFFHRLIMPDGYSLDLDRFQGLNQIGETGLKDKINNHYWQIFGTSIAVGAIGGLAQLGTSTTAAGVPQSSTDIYRQGVGASVSQSSLHILDRFLNVLPTITIREGHRVKVYITEDLLMPDYTQHTMPANL
jgi:type IV secretory pathway VirB10-like protein